MIESSVVGQAGEQLQVKLVHLNYLGQKSAYMEEEALNWSLQKKKKKKGPPSRMENKQTGSKSNENYLFLSLSLRPFSFNTPPHFRKPVDMCWGWESDYRKRQTD